ncbi:hypothetical protein Fcan01_17192 [Folsomia candida]|uniref:Uncharacterized protein n=1 Tax=Folsomia candida TaxID=158441 RepID=A0A226DTX1_FOLCA|nr:hypothetical protein Fcan01_17192 [Folsomia candida]
MVFCILNCLTCTGSEQEFLPVFDTLMYKLEPCDIQVLHDNVSTDWFNINLPIKVVSEFKKMKSKQINIFKSVVDYKFKLAIILSRMALLSGKYNMAEISNTYIGTVVQGYMFFTDSQNREEVQGSDVVMMFVTTKSNRNKVAWSNTNGYDYLKIATVVLLGHGGFEICGWDTTVKSLKEEELYCREETLCGNNFVELYKEIRVPFPVWCASKGATGGVAEVILRKEMSSRFDIPDGSSVEDYILRLAFDMANETAIFEMLCSTHHSIVSIGPENEDLLRTTLVARGTSVCTETTGYEFLTCYRTEYVTLEFYITPFTTWLWAALVSSLTLIVGITSTYKYFGGLRNISFPPWLFILATVFEEAGHIPVRIERNNFFRLVLGSWCLVSVFLTNCYNGIMITELNSPLPTYRPSLFDHLICEKMSDNDISKIFQDYVYFKTTRTNLSVPTDSKERIFKHGHTRIGWYMVIMEDIGILLSLPLRYTSGYPNLPELLEELHRSLINDLLGNQGVNIINKKLLSLLDPRHNHYPRGFMYSSPNQTILQLQHSVEEELLECGKSVFLGKSGPIQTELDFLRMHYPKRKFYKGKEILEIIIGGGRRYQSILEL